MQALELIFIFALVCLQVYVFVQVCKKNKLISTILPHKDSISIRKEYIKDTSNIDVREIGLTEDKMPDNTYRVLYFNSPEQFGNDNEYYFREENASLSEYALVRLVVNESSVYFFPNCSAKRMKMASTWKSYSDMFTVKTISKLNESDKVVCIKRGECEPVPGGWKIVRKAIIEY